MSLVVPFPVFVHMDEIFNDKRSQCKMYICSKELETVGDVLIKIRKMFEIKESVDVFVKDFECLYYIPPSENVEILRSNSRIFVKISFDQNLNNHDKKSAKKKTRTTSPSKKSYEKVQCVLETDLKCGTKNESETQKSIEINTEIKSSKQEMICEGDLPKKREKKHEPEITTNFEKMETEEKVVNGPNKKFSNYSLKSEEVIISECKKSNVSPSYSSTRFENQNLLSSTGLKFKFRPEIKPIKISTKPKLIQSIKVTNDRKNTSQNVEISSDSDSSSQDDSCFKTFNDGLKDELLNSQPGTILNGAATNVEQNNEIEGFTTIKKRKRLRKRKSKEKSKPVQNSFSFVPINKRSISKVTPNPLIHIKFEDEIENLSVKNNFCLNKEEVNSISDKEIKVSNMNGNFQSDNYSSIGNKTEKTKSNVKILNDIKICDSYQMNFSKASNMNLQESDQKKEYEKSDSDSSKKSEPVNKTNMIAVSKVENDTSAKINNTSVTSESRKDFFPGFFPFALPQEKILKYPLIMNIPKNEDIIAFKVYVLSESYTPEISPYVVGKVLHFDEEVNSILLDILDGYDKIVPPKGKFSLEDSDEEMGRTKLYQWREILQPRLLYRNN